jgi:hypothetical protein
MAHLGRSAFDDEVEWFGLDSDNQRTMIATCRSRSSGCEATGEQVQKLVVGSCRQVAHLLRPSVGADDR